MQFVGVTSTNINASPCIAIKQSVIPYKNQYCAGATPASFPLTTKTARFTFVSGKIFSTRELFSLTDLSTISPRIVLDFLCIFYCAINYDESVFLPPDVGQILNRRDASRRQQLLIIPDTFRLIQHFLLCGSGPDRTFI